MSKPNPKLYLLPPAWQSCVTWPRPTLAPLIGNHRHNTQASLYKISKYASLYHKRILKTKPRDQAILGFNMSWKLNCKLADVNCAVWEIHDTTILYTPLFLYNLMCAYCSFFLPSECKMSSRWSGLETCAAAATCRHEVMHSWAVFAAPRRLAPPATTPAGADLRGPQSSPHNFSVLRLGNWCAHAQWAASLPTGPSHPWNVRCSDIKLCLALINMNQNMMSPAATTPSTSKGVFSLIVIIIWHYLDWIYVCCSLSQLQL